MFKRLLAVVAAVVVVWTALAVPPALADEAVSGSSGSAPSGSGPAEPAVKAVAAGPAATYVVLSGDEGLVLMFGGGGYNQPLLVPLLDVRQIAEGPAGRFALLRSGQVWWEDTRGERAEWRLLLDTKDVEEIVVSETGIVLRRSAGALWFYDMAEGSVRPMGLQYVRQVVAGKGWYLVLSNDGTVYGIGDNTYGVLGADVGPGGAMEWVKLPVSGVKAVAGGGQTAYFLLEDGTVVGLGSNAYQTLGTKAPGWTGVPTKIAFPVKIEALAASPDGRNLFALGTGREVYGLGANDSGQLGPGSGYHAVRGTPAKLDLKNAVEIAAGNGFVVARDDSGTVRGVGRTASGQLGTASADPYFGFDTPRTLKVTSSREELLEQALSRARVRSDYLPVARRLFYSLPATAREGERETKLGEVEAAVARSAQEAVARAERDRTLEAVLAAKELAVALRSGDGAPLLERLAPIEQELGKANDRLPPTIVSVTLDDTSLAVIAEDAAQYPYTASGVQKIMVRFGHNSWFTYTGPVLRPASPLPVFVQVTDAKGNTSAVSEWSMDFAAAEEAVSAVEAFRVTGDAADVAQARTVMEQARRAVEVLVEGELKDSLRSRYAQAVMNVQTQLAALVSEAAVKAAEEAVNAFAAGGDGADPAVVADQIGLARLLLDRRGRGDDTLSSRLWRAERQFAVARARGLVADVSAVKVTTKSSKDEILAYKWALERAGLAVAEVPDGSAGASLNISLTGLRATLDEVWANLALTEAETALETVTDEEDLDAIEVLLGEARAAVGGITAERTRSSYERRLERARSSARSARVSLAIRAAAAAAEAVTLDNLSEVEARFETADRLVERLGNSSLRLQFSKAQGVLYERVATLYLDRAEKTLDPEAVKRAGEIIGKLPYSVRKPYEQRLEPVADLLAAEEAIEEAAARRAEWEETLLKTDLSKSRLPVTRAYTNYTSQASKAQKLVEGLPKDATNPLFAKRAEELRQLLEEQTKLQEVADRVMTLVRGQTPKDQKQLKATVGENWALNLGSLYEDDVRRTLGNARPKWANLTPRVLTLYENGQVVTDKTGTGVVIAWTDRGVLRFVIEVREWE